MGISSKLVNEINSFSSLESIVVSNHFHSSGSNETWIGNSVWKLTHLNKLNDGIIVNFDLSLYSPDDSDESDDKPTHIEKEILTFKAGYFNVSFDYECGATYRFLYDIIKDLQFKSLKFCSCSETDACASHLNQYHSISKLNQHYESVEIRDYIPLYALYRFLKAPKLQTLVFRLQFHFLSSIYEKNNSDQDNLIVNDIDFDEMDTFGFIDFKKEKKIRPPLWKGKSGGIVSTKIYRHSQVIHNIKYYIEYGINEDSQIYCSYSRQENENTTIPPYSKLLLEECFKLLRDNKTTTSLRIADQYCGGCDREINSPLSEHFLNDFFGSLSTNKTIKELYLDFKNSISESQKESLPSKIAMMLNQNSTLEYLFVNDANVDEISKLTNTKCKLIK